MFNKLILLSFGTLAGIGIMKGDYFITIATILAAFILTSKHLEVEE